MNLQELTSRSVAGDIDAFNLVSLEGRYLRPGGAHGRPLLSG